MVSDSGLPERAVANYTEKLSGTYQAGLSLHCKSGALLFLSQPSQRTVDQWFRMPFLSSLGRKRKHI